MLLNQIAGWVTCTPYNITYSQVRVWKLIYFLIRLMGTKIAMLSFPKDNLSTLKDGVSRWIVLITHCFSFRFADLCVIGGKWFFLTHYFVKYKCKNNFLSIRSDLSSSIRFHLNKYPKHQFGLKNCFYSWICKSLIDGGKCVIS